MIACFYRIFKLIFLCIVLLIGVVGGLVWFQGDTFVRRYTPAIEAELSQHLQAQVRITDLEIDLFPLPGAVARNVSIVPFGGCGGVTATLAELRIDPLALFQGRYVITSLMFSGIRAEVSFVDGSIGLRGDTGSECPAQGSKRGQGASEASHGASPSARAAGRFETFSLELRDFAVQDAHMVVLGARRHVLRISELKGAATLSEGVLSLESPRVVADIDGAQIVLSARAIRADFLQVMFDLFDGRLALNGEEVLLSGRYGPGAQLTDGKVKAVSFNLAKLVTAVRKVGVNLSYIRSGEVSGAAEVSYSRPRGLSLRTPELQLRKIALDHQGSTYEASLVKGPVECALGEQARVCSADLEFDGFRFVRDALVVSDVSARLEKMKATITKLGDARVSGTLNGSSLRLESPTVRIKSISSLSAPLEVSIPARGSYGVSGVVTGRGVELGAAERELSHMGGDVKISLSATEDSFSTSNLSVNVMEQPVTLAGVLTISPTGYLIREMQAHLAGGAVTLVGEIQRAAHLPFSGRIEVNNASVFTLISVLLGRRESSFEGQIRHMYLSLNGSLVALPSSLKAEGSFQLMSTRVRGFDLTRAVADAISAIPIANLTLAKEKLSDEGLDKSAEATFTLAEEKLHFSALTFYRPQYTLTATGTYSFSKVADLKGAVIFMRQTLTTLGGGFERVGALLGRVGKVEIPVFIRGQVPNISVVPDVIALVKDNSGLTLAGEVLGTTLDAGRSIAGFVLSPFGSRKNEAPSAAENSNNR